MLLKARLHRGLHLLDPFDQGLDLLTRCLVDQGYARTVPAALPAEEILSRGQSGTMPNSKA